MVRVLGRSLFFTMLLASAAFLPPSARAADPLLMFLFSVAQEIASKPGPAAPPAPVERPDVYPGTTVPVDVLRRLIDDSFIYLSPNQRTEIFDALHAELMKPMNFAVRASTIEYFAHRALQVRSAQLRLAKLSQHQKETLAAEFRDELRSFPAEEQVNLRAVVEKGLLPVPSDLNQLLLAAFSD
jgi:hypothetical protein